MSYYVIYLYINARGGPGFGSAFVQNLDFNPFTINGIKELNKMLISDLPDSCDFFVIFNIIPLENE